MPSDHLACNKEVWDELPPHIQRIMEVAMQKLGFQTALTFEVKNNEAAAMLKEQGVTLYDWSQEDRDAFRKGAQAAWDSFAEESPLAQDLVKSHRAFLASLGLGG